MLPCFGAFFYVAARCFSRCLIFWCFWIKPKARKKESKRIFFSIDPSGNNPAPPIVRLLQGADLPPFVTKRWCQKCPPGEKLRETHSASLKRAPVAGLQANRPITCRFSHKFTSFLQTGLLSFFVHRMSLAESAVLLCLHAVRMSLLILRHVVVALFAFCACQCNLSAHDFHLRLNSL